MRLRVGQRGDGERLPSDLHLMFLVGSGSFGVWDPIWEDPKLDRAPSSHHLSVVAQGLAIWVAQGSNIDKRQYLAFDVSHSSSQRSRRPPRLECPSDTVGLESANLGLRTYGLDLIECLPHGARSILNAVGGPCNRFDVSIGTALSRVEAF